MQTRDTQGNIVDILYQDTEKKTKLSIAVREHFEIMADVNILIEDMQLEE